MKAERIERWKEAKVKVLGHWDRMIAFAEKQPGDMTTNELEMKMNDEIKETWIAIYCHFCQMTDYDGSRCEEECPLGIEYGQCGNYSVMNHWGNVANALDVEQWLKFAKKLRKQIKSLKIEEVIQ